MHDILNLELIPYAFFFYDCIQNEPCGALCSKGEQRTTNRLVVGFSAAWAAAARGPIFLAGEHERK